MNSCLQCGKDFARWHRRDKKFCDANCRKRYNRAKHEAEKTCRDVEHHINRLYLTLKRKPQSRTDKAMEQVKFLRGELDNLLRMYDQQTMQERAERDELVSRQRHKREFYTLP